MEVANSNIVPSFNSSFASDFEKITLAKEKQLLFVVVLSLYMSSVQIILPHFHF